MKSLTIVCFTICLLCIVAGVIVSLMLIWGPEETNTLWRSLASIGVFFLASLLTIAVASMVGPKLENGKKD